MVSEKDLEFDQSILTGDNGDIHLLQWLSSLEKAIQQLPVDAIKPTQNQLEATLLKIAIIADPFTNSGRPIRNLVARCYIHLYSKAETRSLFDTLQGLLKVASDPKSPDAPKISALYCVGEIMGKFGANVMSFMAEIGLLSLKLYKQSNASVMLRYQALLALRNSLSTAGRAVSDSLSKDIIKNMKSGLQDKSLPVQRACAEVLMQIYPSGAGGTHTVSDVDSVVSICVKSLDGADQITRRALSRLVGHMLSSTQVERAPVIVPQPKGKQPQEGEEENDNIGGAANTSEQPKALLTPVEMLSQLSVHFHKPGTTRKMRIGIIDFYATLLSLLGGGFVESNYAVVIKHLLHDVVLNAKASTNRYDILLVRTLVGVLIRDLIGVRMLSEQGQIGAIRELATSYLRKWPALMPGQSAPHQLVLVIVLREVAGLLQQLGNAPPPVQEALAEPLLALLAHPNHSTRVSAAWALRCFCSSTPVRLPKLVLTVIELLQRDITTLSNPTAPPEVKGRAIGHAYGLASLFAVIPERPLYVSYDISTRVLDTATQLLKKAGEHDIQIANVEVEVAWTSISSLMALGPNFVRGHLPQLLVLWRNALPKPTSKDTSTGTGRSVGEWMFLIHVRECALGAILCFLKHNSPALVTLDVARRIASLLSNALLFANAFVAQKVEDPNAPSTASPYPSRSSPSSSSAMSLSTREALLRRRVYQCFSALGFSSLMESVQTTLLQSVVTLFASPEGYTGSFVQAAIATSAGNFTSVWQVADGYGYGVTSIDVAAALTSAEAHLAEREKRDRLNRDKIEAAVDDMITRPVLGSVEHDPLLLCRSHISTSEEACPEPPPAATGVVDSAIELFALLLPLQDAASCTRVINQLVESVRSPKFERNAGRKAAVFVNATIALLFALRIATTEHSRAARETLGSPAVAGTLADFLKDAVLSSDVTLRVAGSEALGRLAGLSGTAFLTNQIKFLVEQVVSSRDPNGRAGCALAFGAIYSHVGGLAAQPILKTTVNVLMSLGNDPHPVVHFWALSALGQIINAANLSYHPFITGTLGMLFKIYMFDTHETEGGTIAHANISGDLPTYQVVCQMIDAIVNVLGPELQEPNKTSALVYELIRQFTYEPDEGICVEAIKCVQHYLMFAPDQVEIPQLVNQFRVHLTSSRRPLKMASINALYQLVQRDALMMSKLGGDRLVEDLFGMLDNDPSIDGVRNVITSWLQQTVVLNPSAWIDLCQRIMSRTTASQQVTDAAVTKSILPQMQDDEAESIFGAASSADKRGRLTSRWRTQLFALQCLHSICTLVARSGRREHLDVPYARQQNLPVGSLLVSRVPDLIKMAFTASAAYVTEIRLEGLVVLRDVIEMFAQSPDPLYEDALLLEQHQAPITAALTPAFTSDSTPEILSSAIKACAVFVGCGVVKDISRMGRILKLLTTVLEQSKESGMISMGEIGEFSPNASVMLRISALAAWAELEAASPRRVYLQEVIKPYRAVLASMWIAALRDYASIRGDSEVIQDSGGAAMDSLYFGLGREVLLPYYDEAWPAILKAVGTAMRAQDPHILAAMDGKEANTTSTIIAAPRDDPTAFFFVLFGLVYETLCTSSPDTIAGKETSAAALDVLGYLVRPEYSGKALFEPTIFEEFTSLCYRIAMTGTTQAQLYLVNAIASLASSNTSGLRSAATMNGADEFPPEAPLTHCLRICAYVLRHAIPNARISITAAAAEQKVNLIKTAFQAFGIVGKAFGPTYQDQIQTVSISLYTELLKDEFSEADLAGPTLPALKIMLERPPSPKAESNAQYGRLVHGLLSACLQHIDEMSGRQGHVASVKTKNNMLAAVLVLTVVPSSVQLSKAVIEQCCYVVSQKLMEPDEICITAAHCAKTLISASAAGNPALEHCAAQLVPGMITFIAHASTVVADQGQDNRHLVALDEVLKAFSMFFTVVPEPARARVLGILLPVVALLLDPSKSPPTAVHSAAVQHLLAFATSAPVAFKEAAAKLEQPVRDVLETSIRQAVGGRASAPAQATVKPQISLKAF